MGFKLQSTEEILSFLTPLLGTRAQDFETICSHIGKKSSKEEQAVRSFFFDYAMHLESIKKVQPQKGYYVSVVGNSYIRGITVPTADILVNIHQSFGYRLVDRLNYDIRRHYMKFPRRSNSGMIKQDHILVFQN